MYCILHYEGGYVSVYTVHYTKREAELVFVLYTDYEGGYASVCTVHCTMREAELVFVLYTAL